MPQSKSPENTRQPKNNGRCDDKMKHQRKWLSKRFDEQPRGNVRNDHDRNHPAKNQLEQPGEYHVRIPRDVEKVEIAIDQALRTDDPKAYGCQTEHDGVMHRDAEAKRGDVKQDRERVRHYAQLGQRDANHYATERGIYNAVESKLFGRNSKLAVNRQNQNGI